MNIDEFNAWSAKPRPETADQREAQAIVQDMQGWSDDEHDAFGKALTRGLDVLGGLSREAEERRARDAAERARWEGLGGADDARPSEPA